MLGNDPRSHQRYVRSRRLWASVRKWNESIESHWRAPYGSLTPAPISRQRPVHSPGVPAPSLLSYTATLIEDECALKQCKGQDLPGGAGGRTCLPAGDLGFDPCSGKIPYAMEKLSPCAPTTEPRRCSYWARAPQQRSRPVRDRSPNEGGPARSTRNKQWVS